MNRRKVTIILGAGASKAYKRWPYPLLGELLSEIFEYAPKLPDEGMRQHLYLAYVFRTVYAPSDLNLDSGIIPKEVIQKEFERIKTLHSNKNNLFTVFEELERLNNETATKAYWALTYAIATYMWQMEKEDIDQSSIGYIDRAHKRLINLIDKMLSHGIIVNIIDFNYDCVLERVRYSLGEPRFGWDCGRERKVIADTLDNTAPSVLVKTNRFQPPRDETKYSTWVGLIKPHGDMCTFLRGKTDVFYRGGRHSHVHTAIFPPKLADISSDDQFMCIQRYSLPNLQTYHQMISSSAVR